MWLRGAKAGASDVFVDALPGFPAVYAGAVHITSAFKFDLYTVNIHCARLVTHEC